MKESKQTQIYGFSFNEEKVYKKGGISYKRQRERRKAFILLKSILDAVIVLVAGWAVAGTLPGLPRCVCVSSFPSQVERSNWLVSCYVQRCACYYFFLPYTHLYVLVPCDNNSIFVKHADLMKELAYTYLSNIRKVTECYKNKMYEL